MCLTARGTLPTNGIEMIIGSLGHFEMTNYLNIHFFNKRYYTIKLLKTTVTPNIRNDDFRC